MTSLLLSALLLLPAEASRPNVKRLLQRLESRYHGARTLGATFLERYSEGRRSVRIESGRVFFRRPGKMRWEYEVPEKKLFVADGKYVWFYVPSDRTVTRARTKESRDWRTPLGLLTGNISLSRLCQSIDLASRAPLREAGHAVLRCTPRGETRQQRLGRNTAANAAKLPDADFDEVFLEFDEGTGDLASVVVRQAGGIEIEYRFAKWQRDPGLSDALFHFQAPVGVAIVEEGSLVGASGSKSAY